MTITQGEIFDAILELKPNASFEVHEDKSIVWNDTNQTQPTMAEIENQIPITKFNNALFNLRQKRNSLLSQTDYLALSDQTMSAEMTTYRQALRDITNGLTTVADVEAVVFPEKPEV
jgi:hypothetical protein